MEACGAQLHLVNRRRQERDRRGRLRARSLSVDVRGSVNERAQDLLHGHSLAGTDVAWVPWPLPLDELERRLACTVEVPQGVSMSRIEDPHRPSVGSLPRYGKSVRWLTRRSVFL